MIAGFARGTTEHVIACTLALGSLLGLASVASQAQPPAPEPASAQPKLKRRVAVGMTIGGAVATAGFLGGSALIGASLLDAGDDVRRSMGRVLPIPFVGPFLAASRAREAAQKPAPVIALGFEQLVSAAVLTVGAVSLHRHRTLERARGETRRIETKTAVGMTAGGVTMFMLTYGLTLGFNRERARLGDPYARRMQVPLVGGYLAAAHAPSHVRGFGALTNSTLQLGAAAVTTIGAIALGRERARRRQVAVMPFGDATGVHVTATWRF